MKWNTLRPRFPSVLLITLLSFAFLVACKSPKVAPGTPDDGSLASVFVTNSTRSAVSDVVFNVFRENGFMLKSSLQSDLVFERQGTKWDTLAYGGWFENIWIRARVVVSIYEPGVFRVACKAYRVDGRGDISTGEEKSLPRTNAGYYQGLLNQVRTRIDAAAGIPPVPAVSQ